MKNPTAIFFIFHTQYNFVCELISTLNFYNLYNF